MSRISSALLVLMISCPALAQWADPDVSEYPVLVQERGTVRVKLPIELSGAAQSVTVNDPDGQNVPAMVVRPSQGETSARIDGAERIDGQWHLRIDTGLLPQRHEAIRLDMNRTTFAPRCRVESSDDKETWTQLAEGDLFRLGDEESLQQTELRYPATSARFLRVIWPESAGLPEFTGVQIERTNEWKSNVMKLTPRAQVGPLPHSGLMVSLIRASFDLTPGSIETDMTKPLQVSLRSLDDTGQFGTEISGLIGAEQSVYPQSTSSSWIVVGPPESSEASYLFYSTPTWVVFEAPYGGEYVLKQAPRLGADLSRAYPVTDLTAGSARKSVDWQPDRFVPQRTRKRPLGRTSWDLDLEGAEGGDVIRLALSGDVLRRVKGSMWTLRLVTEDSEHVPFAQLTEPFISSVDMQVDSSGLASIPSIDARGRLARLDLFAPVQNLERGFRTHRRSPARLGVDSLSSRLDEVYLSCRRGQDAPCRTTLVTATRADLPPSLSDSGTIDIEIQDYQEGDRFDVVGYGTEFQVAFVHPGKKVRLEAGYDSLPFQDQVSDTDRLALLAQPFQSRRVTSEALLHSAIPQLESRWILLGVLTLVVAFLLFLVGRMLRS